MCIVCALSGLRFLNKGATHTPVLQIGFQCVGQVAGLTVAQVDILTTAQIQILNAVQIEAFPITQIAALKIAQIQSLTNDQVQSLTPAQIAGLTATQIGVLSTGQIAALTGNQIAALTTAQVLILKTSQLSALTTGQVVALTTLQVSALKTAQIAVLTTMQVAALETTDLAALTTTQINALTDAQVAAMSVAQTMALDPSSSRYATPIVLDLDGNGIRTLSVSAGVKFDVYAVGRKVNTGWVDRRDGLLVLDRNLDGMINDGRELFGSATTLASGEKAQDGYAVLREMDAKMDANQDGVISGTDAVFGALRVWIDANSDGISEAAEMRTLNALGIASLKVDAVAMSVKDNGNWIGLSSSYEATDGATHETADVWFVAKKPVSNLPLQVAGLVQAMAMFDGTQPESEGSARLQMNLPSSSFQDVATRLADTLRHFDVNGTRIGKGTESLALPAHNKFSSPVVPDANQNGFPLTDWTTSY